MTLRQASDAHGQRIEIRKLPTDLQALLGGGPAAGTMTRTIKFCIIGSIVRQQLVLICWSACSSHASADAGTPVDFRQAGHNHPRQPAVDAVT